MASIAKFRTRRYESLSQIEKTTRNCKNNLKMNRDKFKKKSKQIGLVPDEQDLPAMMDYVKEMRDMKLG